MVFRTKQARVRGLSVLLVLLVLFIAGMWSTHRVPTARAATPISQIDTSLSTYNRFTMLVDHQPFFYQGIQVPYHQLTEWWGWSDSDVAALFPIIQSNHFNTIQMIIWWKDIEPTKDTFDYSKVDKFINWAQSSGLRLEIIWGGSDFTGETKADRVPAYVFSNYQKTLDSTSTPISIQQTQPTGTWTHYLMDKTDPNLLAREESVLQGMMNHIATYNAANGNHDTVIGVDVLNEPAIGVMGGIAKTDRSYSTYSNTKWTSEGWTNVAAFRRNVMQHYLSGLAQAVKTSNYPVWTRSNFAGWQDAECISENEMARTGSGTYLDFIGDDAYISGNDGVYDYGLSTSKLSVGKNMPMIMENGGNYPNTDQLLIAALAGGVTYNIYSIADINNSGLYVQSTSNLHQVVPRGSYVSNVNNINTMLAKEWYDLASKKPDSNGGTTLDVFNRQASTSSDTTKNLGANTVEYITANAGQGIAVRRDDGQTVLMSTTASTFKLPVGATVTSATVGYFDSTNTWVSSGDQAYTTSGGQPVFSLNAYEVVEVNYSSPVSLTYEAETLPATSSSDATVTIVQDSNASNGAFSSLNSVANGDYISYTISVPVTGTYTIAIRERVAYNKGIYQLKIDGVNQGSAQDEYAATAGYTLVTLGTQTLTAGNHTFMFTATGKNMSSSGYYLGFDYIKLSQ